MDNAVALLSLIAAARRVGGQCQHQSRVYWLKRLHFVITMALPCPVICPNVARRRVMRAAETVAASMKSVSALLASLAPLVKIGCANLAFLARLARLLIVMGL